MNRKNLYLQQIVGQLAAIPIDYALSFAPTASTNWSFGVVLIHIIMALFVGGVWVGVNGRFTGR